MGQSVYGNDGTDETRPASGTASQAQARHHSYRRRFTTAKDFWSPVKVSSETDSGLLKPTAEAVAELLSSATSAPPSSGLRPYIGFTFRCSPDPDMAKLLTVVPVLFT